MKHFTSCGFLIQSLDKYLLCHPSNLRVGVKAGDKGWGLPKGKVDDEHESLFACALRETREETNLNLALYPAVKFSINPIFSTSYLTNFNGERVSKTIQIFFAHDKEGILQSLPLSCPTMVEGTNITEMDDFRWVTKVEAKKICTHSIRDLFENVEQYTRS